MGALVQDLRYSLRTQARSPLITLAIVLTLGLGIGANAAIFSAVDALLLRPSPYPGSDRLIHLRERNLRMGWDEALTSYPGFSEWSRHSRTLQEVAAYHSSPVNLTGQGDPERVTVTWASDRFFETMGVTPFLGRAFRNGEDRVESPGVVVLSHRFWQNRLGGRPDALGSKVLLDSVPYTIVGIMPPRFRFPAGDTALWAPLRISRQMREWRPQKWLRVIARVHPGIEMEAVSRDLEAVVRWQQEQHPVEYKDIAITRIPFREFAVRSSRAKLLGLNTAVALVLLVACSTVASLFLARASSRQSEIAVRRVLGAGAFRIVRQVFTEGCLLAFAGAAVGLVVARPAIGVMTRMAPEGSSAWVEATLNLRVLAFVCLLSVLTTLAFALAPALHLTKLKLVRSLRSADRSVGGEGIWRAALASCQLAMALILLVGAGLLFRSFNELMRVDPGFRPQGLLTLSLSLPSSKYSRLAGVRGFHLSLAQRLGRIPEVASVGMIDSLPFVPGYVSQVELSIEGREPTPDSERRKVRQTVAGLDFFPTMGIPLIRGRLFSSGDLGAEVREIIINESMARQFWPGRDPLGSRVKWGADRESDQPWREVVGVVGDMRHEGLESRVQPEAFMPYLQLESPRRSMHFVVRTRGEPLALAEAVRAAVWAEDPELPVSNLSSMKELVASSVSQRRFYLLMLSLFAGVALILSAIGVYGLLSFNVSRSVSEIGLRMAMGAQGRDALLLILGRAAKLALVGLSSGLAVSLAGARLLRGSLFGVSPLDPVTFLSAVLVLLLLTLAAALIPALRASRVDPIAALRIR